MKVSALKYTILSWVSTLTMLILFLMPFHALITVWGSSLIGHYIALRLWKEVLVLVCGIGVLALLFTDHKIRSHTLSRRLAQLILLYIGLNIAWGLYALHKGDVTATALGYGLVVNLRFLIFFLITWSVALRMARLHKYWQRLVLWPAAAVVVIGLLQVFVLPHDFFKHFGYGPETISAYETINNNDNYYRAFSTLRGPNPLGAYLLIPISVLVVLLIGVKRNWKQGALLAGSLLLLFFTFSRSAWIGAALAVGTILLVSVRSQRFKRLTAGALAGVAVVGALITLAFHDNSNFQNYIFHTEDKSAIATSSNSERLDALESGFTDVTRDPLGDGPGTAGPASVYNEGKSVSISENYFLQVAQETGLIGLALFLLINIGVGYLLWLRRADPLALSLFASLIGLTFINLLSHAWTDDTLAYIWWGLAGIAIVKLPELRPDDQP